MKKKSFVRSTPSQAFITYILKSSIFSALDPAGPYFDLQSSAEKRVKQTDAEFVDVIHTNSGSILNVSLLEYYQCAVALHFFIIFFLMTLSNK